MLREDWLLLVVAAGDKTLTPVQLQKTLFLVGQEGLPDASNPYYKFTPYHFGPFDPAIYQDADKLHGEDLLVRHRSAEGTWVDTAITGSGRTKALTLEEELPDRVVAYIHKLVSWAQRLSFRELVSAVYSKYPDFRANSVFQD